MSKAESKKILVEYRGSYIFHKFSIDTFVETIEKLGIEKVQQMNLHNRGYDFISKEENKYSKPLSNGLYLTAHTSNEEKLKFLEKINSHLKKTHKIKFQELEVEI